MDPYLTALDGTVRRIVPGVANDLMPYQSAWVFRERAQSGDNFGLLTFRYGEQIPGPRAEFFQKWVDGIGVGIRVRVIP